MTYDQVKQFFDQLVSQNNGKYISVLNPGKQCFDVAVKFTDMIGVPHAPGNPSPFPYPNASQIYTDYGSFQAQYFDRIANSATFVPQKGDIVVWDKALNGNIGHVSVATGEGDTKTFKSFDQNWIIGSVCTVVTHTYSYVLGVLRFKVTQSTQDVTLPKELQQYSTEWKDLALKDGLDVNSDQFTNYRAVDLQISLMMKNATKPLQDQIDTLKTANQLLTSQSETFKSREEALNTEIEDLTEKLSADDVEIKDLTSTLSACNTSTSSCTTDLAECKSTCQSLQKQLANKPIEKVYKTKAGKALKKLADQFG